MTYNEMWRQLSAVYPEGEAKAIVRTLLEDRFGLSFTDIVCGGVEALSNDDTRELQQMMERLTSNEPVQYVTGCAMFCGRQFGVGQGVLIPRPETEELCQWIISENSSPGGSRLSILDIGTGSGCIAITLALDIPQSEVSAWDISEDALRIAGHNAEKLDVDISFVRQDILEVDGCDRRWDVIVSNPPYICDSERSGMERNVLDYEPHVALFVPDSAPLLFYEAITKYAVKALKAGGRLYFEINSRFAEATASMMQSFGFRTETRCDQYGRPRMIKGEME